MRLLASGSLTIRRKFDCRASGSPGGDSRPVSPGMTASPIPPTSVATTGIAALIASRMLYGKASERDESTNTCEEAINFAYIAPKAKQADTILKAEPLNELPNRRLERSIAYEIEAPWTR